MKIYSLGQNCGATDLVRDYFNCESSFFDWAITPSIGVSLRFLLLESNILKTIIYGQHQVIHDGATVNNEFVFSQFKLDSIIFSHYPYKDVEHIITLVRRFCRIKLAFNDLKNNMFFYLLNVPELYKKKDYYYSFCLLKNQDIIKKIEDNVLFFNPFNCDLEIYEPPILKFKNVFNGNFKYSGYPSKEVKSDINKWCSDILKDKFPQLKENNRTIKEKTSRIPDFFKEVYNTKDHDEFLYNVENLGIIRYIANNGFTVKCNRNSITYSNDYFSISAKDDNELWNKIFDFCMKSVKFTDNFTINRTT